MHMGSLRVLSRVLGSCGVGASFAPPCCARATSLIATWLRGLAGCHANCRGCATSSVAAARRRDERVVEPAPVPAYLLRPMNHPRLASDQALTGTPDLPLHAPPRRG